MGESELVQLINENIIPPREAPSKKPDQITKKEERSWEEAHLKDWARLQRRSFRQDTAERKKYAHHVFCLLCVWLAAMFALIVLAGFRPCGFQIVPSVQIALISGTTVDVLGLFVIVVSYLFPGHGPIRDRAGYHPGEQATRSRKHR